MARKHPPRRGLSPGATIAGPRYACRGCPETVSRSRLWCRSCWARLGSAPGGLRERLVVPPGENVHLWTDAAYRADVAAAQAYLARLRTPAGGARWDG